MLFDIFILGQKSACAIPFLHISLPGSQCTREILLLTGATPAEENLLSLEKQ